MRNFFRVTLTASFILLGQSLPAHAVNNPNAPVGVSATSSSGSNAALDSGTLSVSWQRPDYSSSHPIPIAYIVTATSGTQVVSVTVPLVATTTIGYSTVLSGLTGGNTYSVVVTSKTSENATAAATAVNAVPITAPAVPDGLAAVVAPGAVTLTWNAPSSNGGSSLTGYIVKDDKNVETVISGGTALTKTFTGLSAGASITYSVKATNANGYSAWSSQVTVTLPTKPGKPTAVTATAGQTSITVSWAAPSSTGNSAITGYKIYLYNSVGAQVGATTPSATTTKELTGISAGSYTVKVLATNLVGDGDLSDASSIATIAAASALLANIPVFTPSNLPNLQIGATQAFSVSSPSGETITVTASASPSGACTYSNGIVTAVSEGTCTVLAVASATSTYSSGRLTKVFSVTKTLQTITFGVIANQPLPGPYTASATTTSGLTVTFTATGACTASGNTISFTGEGLCTLTAAQAGNGTYATANPVQRAFNITANPSGGNQNSNQNNNSNNSNNGGGSSGGNSSPGPTPVVTPVPTASPTPTAIPSPAPSGSATPTPSAIPTPAPSVTATASPTPSPTSSTSGITTKTSTFAVSTSGKISGPIKASTLSAATTSIAVKSNANFQPTLPVVNKGEKITMVIKDAKGKSYTVAALTVSKSGSLKLPTVKFTQTGSYTITIKVGTKTKVVKVTSTK